MINRSSFLRAMDKDMAFRVVDKMEQDGVKVMGKTVPVAVKKVGEKEYEVELDHNGKSKKITVNTILVAIGRDCQSPDKLGLDSVGLKYDNRSFKIIGRDSEKERTNVDHIYAIGDTLQDVPELMPVAAKSGNLLAHRIHQRLNGDLKEPQIQGKYSTDYRFIPTTVFSPTEYSFVGLSEQEAIEKYGDENVEIYHREVTPLHFSIVKNNLNTAYMKVITLKNQDELVLGIHYFGPGADEVIAGYALSMKLGVKKSDMDSSFGVHPSVSEDLFGMEITKRSGEDYSKTDC